MKILIIISQIITGIVFTFSGIVKAIDPTGTQIKFEDYFHAMGLELMIPTALFFSFLMNAAELITGLMLLFNVLPKFTSWIALGFLAIFTPVTLWLAVANPVSDCGCFGDAITLTNWQTFGKNIILLIFILIIFINRKNISSYFKQKISLFIFGGFIVISFLFEFYNYNNLPIVDFRPYKVGVNIFKNATTPPDAPKDIYETILIYKNKKTGEKKKFTLENYPQDTLTWEFAETINNLIKKGYEPPIHDFVITDENQDEITKQILSDKNTSYIIVSYELESGNYKYIEEIKKITEHCKKNNLNVYCFTASSEENIKSYKQILPKNIQFCTADKKMLKTMVRSNPGLVVIKNGIIKGKFHFGNFKIL